MSWPCLLTAQETYLQILINAFIITIASNLKPYALYLFIFVLIYDLLNEAVSISPNNVSNYMMINE